MLTIEERLVILEQQVTLLLEQLNAPCFWTMQDIADHLQVGLVTVKTRLVCKEGFPEAIAVTESAERGHKRWVALEVIEWLKKNRRIRRKTHPK